MSMMLNPYRFAVAGASGPTSTQWRILFPTGNSRTAANPNLLQVYEVEMRATSGGADQCSGGSASASTTFAGSAASNAFDNNTGTSWSASAAAYTDWIQYTFASAVGVEEVYIKHFDINKCPSSVEVQYYNGSSWVTYFDSKPLANGAITATATTTPIVVTNDNTYTAPTGYKKWRLYINSVQSSTVADIQEIELMPAGGSFDQCFGIIPTSSADASGSFPKTSAFDNSSGTRWASGTGMPQWIGAEFQREKMIEKVTFTAQTTTQALKNVDVQYYNDGTASWVTHWSFVGAASTAQQTFNK